MLDASVALSWLFTAESSITSRALRQRSTQTGVVVPLHWKAELANGALIGERRQRIEASATTSFVTWMTDLDIEFDQFGAEHAFLAILPLARAHRLTVYDALYLELAQRRGLSLATFDSQLAAAAAAVGVEVLTA